MTIKQGFLFKMTSVFVLLLATRTASFAAFPPVLVIAGTAYPGTQVNGAGGDTYYKYSTSNSVLLLHGATGGIAAIGATETAALNSPTTTGTWDGGLNVYLTGTTVIVPQVLVYYPAAITPSAIQGYDGNQHQPAGSGSANGEFVVAYNGLSSGYIFDFGTGQPIYRYQAGTSPICLDTTNGWPPPNVFIFPSQITNSGKTYSVTSYTSGLTNGYWANAYYATTDGSNIYGELHAYIPSDGSSGQLYGDVNGTSVSAQWNSTTSTFVASPNLGVDFSSPTTPPTVGSAQYGPPQVECNGLLLPFAFNDVNGSDVYWDSTSGTWIIIDSSDSVTTSGGSSGTYDPASKMFSDSADFYYGGLAAVSADGTTFLGNDGSGGIQIKNVSDLEESITYGSSLTSTGVQYYFTQPNGRYAEYFLASQWYNVSGPFIFQDSSYNFSPIYNGPSSYSQIEYLDGINGMPSGDLPPLALPNPLYVNGQEFDLDQDGSLVQQGLFNEGDYSTPDNISSFHFTEDVHGMYCENQGNTNLIPQSFTLDQDTMATGSGYSNGGSLYITFAQPSYPQYGPPKIFWSGISYGFYLTQGGTDIYVDSSTGHELFLSSTDHVTASNASINGTFTPGTNAFNITGMIAQDGNGNLLGTPPGLVVIFKGGPNNPSPTTLGGIFGQAGQSIQLGNGTIRNSSNTTVYNVLRNDGTWFVEYLGVPAGSLFTVDSSPVYRFSSTNGSNVVLDTTISGDWPTYTNIFPSTLYINGQLATIDSSSLVSTAMTGSVNYLVQPNTGDMFNVTWSWVSGISGATAGSFESTSWSTGAWDGTLFGSLPTGMVISNQPPPQSPHYGPSQILWNGLQLTFNGVASSVSASNPTGADVYEDSVGLGLVVAVDSNNNVTAQQNGGTVVAGTYDFTTHQFQFASNSVGDLQATNSQGFAYPANGGQLPTISQGTTDIDGNVDIHGNVFSFGNWTDTSGNSINAFTLAYVSGENGGANLLNFAATRQMTEWIWSDAVSDQTENQVTAMLLSPSHALQLFSPTNPTTPAIVLDPGGKSHIEPQGDLSMGEFTQQPQ